MFRMARTTAPVILVMKQLAAEQEARLRAIAPAARIVGEGDIDADPRLVESVEICYPSLPKDLWKKARRLHWLQTDTAGMDSVLENAEARAHPAIFTNVHNHADTIAQHLWGMTLMLTRNLHLAVRAQGEGRWDRERLMEGLSTIAGKTLCVTGLGVIGTRCAELGRAFGMRVIGISRHARSNQAVQEVAGPAERQAVFARSRVIMLVLPNTPETRGFVGREELKAMQGAFLLNAGRGPSVDTDALVDALRDGSVRGAGLDVTDPEPLPAGHPLWTMPNVIITPHYGGAHPGYDDEAFDIFCRNLERWVAGEKLHNVVDKDAGY
jgi:phosphoglycerate dehydrogenase-like enzyme